MRLDMDQRLRRTNGRQQRLEHVRPRQRISLLAGFLHAGSGRMHWWLMRRAYGADLAAHAQLLSQAVRANWEGYRHREWHNIAQNHIRERKEQASRANPCTRACPAFILRLRACVRACVRAHVRDCAWLRAHTCARVSVLVQDIAHPERYAHHDAPCCCSLSRSYVVAFGRCQSCAVCCTLQERVRTPSSSKPSRPAPPSYDEVLRTYGLSSEHGINAHPNAPPLPASPPPASRAGRGEPWLCRRMQIPAVAD